MLVNKLPLMFSLVAKRSVDTIIRIPRMNAQERKTVSKMIRLYCRHKHGSRSTLCADCSALRDYTHQRLYNCVYGNDKPTCEKCPVHCYAPARRTKIKEIMRYAGPRMLFYHPILAIKHLLKNK